MALMTTVTPSKGRLAVDTENILPIIKKWLYSQKEIFLRELISNAFDAISKAKKVALNEDIRDANDTDYAIHIRIERDKNLLIIEDNGIGMTADEVQKYIANIAFSGAQDFVKKYEEAGDKNKAGIIGNFGLGFYSSFMVADKVEVDSLSYRPDASAVHWVSNGGADYEMDASKRQKRGTTITLHLNSDAQELSDKAKISELVRRFVDFLPIAVFVDGAQANRCDPLWAKPPTKLKKENYDEFYKYLYPFQGAPLFYVHLNADYPFALQGVLFFPRLRHEMDLNRSNVKIYCKQVFVSDDAQDLIPKYLTVLQGVIDIPDLPLNVSRSYLQNEPQIKKIASYIVKKVADRLQEERQKNRKNYESIWSDVAPFIKYAMMNDERFYEQAENALIFQLANSDAAAPEQFLTIEEYQAKYKEKIGDKIYYASDPKSQAAPLRLLEKQGIGVVLLDALIDSHFIQLLETKGKDYRFARVDAEVSDHVLDKESESKLVDAQGHNIKSELEELFKKALNNDKVTIRVEALKDANMPAMVVLPEHMRRYQEMSAMMSQGVKAFELSVEHTLMLNSKNEIIRALARPTLVAASGAATETDKKSLMARQIYYLARLAQGSLDRNDLDNALDVSYSLLKQLT